MVYRRKIHHQPGQWNFSQSKPAATTFIVHCEHSVLRQQITLPTDHPSESNGLGSWEQKQQNTNKYISKYIQQIYN